MNGRVYDPKIGRFMSPNPSDALAPGVGFNRYAYVRNNPVSLTDPSGFCIWDACAAEGFLALTGIGIIHEAWNSEEGQQLQKDLKTLNMVWRGIALAPFALMVSLSESNEDERDRAVPDARSDTKVDEDDEERLYRSMRKGEDGLPAVGPTARTLGVRTTVRTNSPRTDIPVDDYGNVKPGTGGMSASPGSPANLPDFRRPPAFGGTGPDPVWGIKENQLPPGLQYRPDPLNPLGHGFIEPTNTMTLEEYERALESTRDAWEEQ